MSSVEEITHEIKLAEDELKVLNKKHLNIIESIKIVKCRIENLKNETNILRNKEVLATDWNHNKFVWQEAIERILQDRFHLKTFRSQQQAAINAVLSGKDALVVMPTGGGKSLCYQLPAFHSNGVTLVVSPLLSLIEDQIIGLSKLGLTTTAAQPAPATTISSATNYADIKLILDALASDTSIKLLYVTPEWMAKSKRFMTCLQKCYARKALDRIAIDEVHCCSQWGHDFRLDYKFLGILKNLFPDVPMIGLTATATEAVIADIQNMLNIHQGCVILRASFNRPNLYYEVKQKPANQADCVQLIVDLLKNKYTNQSGIIYTTTISDSVQLASELKKNGLSAASYHANMDANARCKVHERWLSNRYQVVVATVAFGMGIDKSDVRFVIHYAIPKSMENFYQESGRAGRDDQIADCLLLYSMRDVFRISAMVCTTTSATKNLYKLIEYCLDTNKCRRALIALHFDENWNSSACNKMCDHCRNEYYMETIDITKYCIDLHRILNHATNSDVRLTAIQLLDAWYQTSQSKLSNKANQPSDLRKPNIPKERAENIIAFLLIQNYLKEDIHFTPYSTICYISTGKSIHADSNIFMNIARIVQKQLLNTTTATHDSLPLPKRKRI